MKILIADEHGMCREGLKTTLANMVENTEIHEAETRTEVMSLLTAHQNFDFAILDLRLGDGGGLEMIEDIHKTYPQLSIAVFSANDDPSIIQSIMALGISGYLPKRLKNSVLQNAIRLILSGSTYIPQQIIDLPRSGNMNGKSKVLTPRQRQVLGLIAEGFSNKEIGRSLELAEGTIKSHVATLLRSLGARNRTEATTKAKQVGYIY